MARCTPDHFRIALALAGLLVCVLFVTYQQGQTFRWVPNGLLRAADGVKDTPLLQSSSLASLNRNLLLDIEGALQKLRHHHGLELLEMGGTSPDHRRFTAAFRKLLLRQENITFAVTGGSSTAGGGLKRGVIAAYPHRVVNFLNSILENHVHSRVILKNSAHGTTNTLWSALLLDSLVGIDPDILASEFTLNDDMDRASDALGSIEVDRASELMANRELWIRKTQQLPSQPALLFVNLYDYPPYYDRWPTPNSVEVIQEKANLVYREHISYVSVSLGQYIAANETLAADKNMVLADMHHPNEQSHLIIADLICYKLLKLMAKALTGSEAAESNIYSFDWASPSSIIFPWNQQQPLLDANTLTAASFLVAPPLHGEPRLKTKVCIQPMGQPCPRQQKASFDDALIVQQGKASPLRNDRQLSLALPSCSLNNSLVFELDFDLRVYVLTATAEIDVSLNARPVKASWTLDAKHPGARYWQNWKEWYTVSDGTKKGGDHVLRLCASTSAPTALKWAVFFT